MRVLAIEHEGDAAVETIPEALLEEEARRVWELYQRGVVREMSFRADRRAAVLVLECDGGVEAEAALATLPLVRTGHIAFEVIPLRPYPGLARLFRT